jgi:hypothetical protein
MAISDIFGIEQAWRLSQESLWGQLQYWPLPTDEQY